MATGLYCIKPTTFLLLSDLTPPPPSAKTALVATSLSSISVFSLSVRQGYTSITLSRKEDRRRSRFQQESLFSSVLPLKYILYICTYITIKVAMWKIAF